MGNRAPRLAWVIYEYEWVIYSTIVVLYILFAASRVWEENTRSAPISPFKKEGLTSCRRGSLVHSLRENTVFRPISSCRGVTGCS